MHSKPFILAILTVLMFMFVAVSANAVNQSNLNIIDCAICRSVENYKVLAAGNTFPASVDKLYCLTKVTGTDFALEVTHVWY